MVESSDKTWSAGEGNGKLVIITQKTITRRKKKNSLTPGSQYCENDYTTKCNLQIQCNPYQITNGIFHRTGTKNSTIHMETQKTLNSQSSLEKEEWNWRNRPS